MSHHQKSIDLQKFTPGQPINQYVDCIHYIKGNTKGTSFSKTAMSLVFNLKDYFKLYMDDTFSSFLDYKKYWIAGFQTQPVHVESYGESEMIAIQFNTLGAHLFLRSPLYHFTNQYVALDCIYTQQAENTWQQLMESSTSLQKFMVVERFLNSIFKYEEMQHYNLIAHTIQQLLVPGHRTIATICNENNISRKHLNNLFKNYIGISPKMLSSFHRLQRALQLLSSDKPDRLNRYAYELEYFDQSHFNNDFKRLTGLKPTDYLNHVARKPSVSIVPHFIPYN